MFLPLPTSCLWLFYANQAATVLVGTFLYLMVLWELNTEMDYFMMETDLRRMSMYENDIKELFYILIGVSFFFFFGYIYFMSLMLVGLFLMSIYRRLKSFL